MPKNKVSDPITDQEIAFARLVLSGGMTDRQAAEAVGLNPDSAAYTKAKPRVRAYMLEHRAAVQQQLVQQDADEGQRRLNPDREQVLDRLWELANLSPDMTRNSITGQVKALAMIIAMENFIPDRRTLSAEKKSAPTSAPPEFYKSAWLREKQAATIDPQPTPAPPVPACRGTQEEAPEVPPPDLAPEPAPGSPAEAPPDPVPSQPAFAHRVPLADGVPPYVPQSSFVPDTRVPFSIKVNPFKHRR
jgi:hypothetical protein